MNESFLSKMIPRYLVGILKAYHGLTNLRDKRKSQVFFEFTSISHSFSHPEDIWLLIRGVLTWPRWQCQAKEIRSDLGMSAVYMLNIEEDTTHYLGGHRLQDLSSLSESFALKERF